MRGDELARRDPLQCGVHGGEQDRGAAPFGADEPRQGEHALRDRARVRRHAVVRQAVPRRELEHEDFRREERERAAKLSQARGIAADRHEGGYRRFDASSDRAGKIRDHQCRGPVGHAGERERPAQLQGFRR